MTITNKLKERFCKDCNIPLRVFDEPYFTEDLYLLNATHNTIEKWELFLKSLENYDDEQEYFAHYNQVKDQAMAHIHDSEAFQRFEAVDIKAYDLPEWCSKLPCKDVFKDDMVNKLLLSIDMRQANFSVLSYYDSDIFGTDSWEDFIKKFTDNEHIIQSKYIREVILGNCNPKRQVKYEKYLMHLLLHSILTEIPEYRGRVVFFSNDEIVFETDLSEMKIITRICGIIRQFMSEHPKLRFRNELFKSEKIPEGYVKKLMVYENGSCPFRLKKVEAALVPMVTARLTNTPMREEYKVFTYNGRLAKFI